MRKKTYGKCGRDEQQSVIPNTDMAIDASVGNCSCKNTTIVTHNTDRSLDTTTKNRSSLKTIDNGCLV